MMSSHSQTSGPPLSLSSRSVSSQRRRPLDLSTLSCLRLHLTDKNKQTNTQTNRHDLTLVRYVRLYLLYVLINCETKTLRLRGRETSGELPLRSEAQSERLSQSASSRDHVPSPSARRSAGEASTRTPGQSASHTRKENTHTHASALQSPSSNVVCMETIRLHRGFQTHRPPRQANARLPVLGADARRVTVLLDRL